MHEILWAGETAPNVVLSSLRALDITIAARSSSPLAFLVSTRTAEVPSAPSLSTKNISAKTTQRSPSSLGRLPEVISENEPLRGGFPEMNSGKRSNRGEWA